MVPVLTRGSGFNITRIQTTIMDMKPYKLPKMSSKEISKLLEKEKICRIAFKGEEFPYMAPFQYVKMGEALYFHFTNYGKKMQLIEKDKRVCVGVESLKTDMSEYNFVVLKGELERVEDSGERAEAIRRLADAGRRRLSENFLAAHGFLAEQGWDILSEDKPMVIFKLARITDTIGLRSPS
jgi:nitroimidazol reductase NimA-like FMN-containing flavoprotein (pyridoxamine 5'-phosphate oxidase superfamily)